MKILHAYNSHRGRGGADVALETTLRSSVALGLELYLFNRDSRDLPSGLVGNVRALAAGVYSRASVREFERALHEFRPDAVHVHELYPLISPWILPRCTKFGVPVVMSVTDFQLTCPVTTHFSKSEVCFRCVGGHEQWALLKNCRKNLPESAAYALFAVIRRWFHLYQRHVDRFIAPTNFLGRWLVENAGIPADRVVTVYPPVPVPPTAVDPAAGTYIAWAGRFTPGKGADVLVRASRECALPVRLAGDKERMDGVQPGDNVQFVMTKGREEIAAFYRGARMLVVPSIWLETFGLVAAEAMSHGLPVVASRIGGLVENIEDGVTGFLFEPGNHKELAEKLTRLWNDADMCRRFGRAGRQRVVERFRDEDHCQRLLAVYEDVCS
jgi:glycosyltransferase involved in cell wall biosynthesis